MSYNSPETSGARSCGVMANGAEGDGDVAGQGDGERILPLHVKQEVACTSLERHTL